MKGTSPAREVSSYIASILLNRIRYGISQWLITSGNAIVTLFSPFVYSTYTSVISSLEVQCPFHRRVQSIIMIHDETRHFRANNFC